MKIRILDRILVALAGLILVAACVGLVGQVFLGKDVIGFATKQLTRSSTTAKIVIGACAALLLILGIYCVLMLFRHRSRKDKFILQKMETGELAISLTTLETMVRKCLDQHPEIKTEQIRLENQRDGLLVRVRGIVAGGISIPLTIDTLQKQIKQYVTACSGVEVKGIRIQIEASGEDAKDAPFAIEAPAGILLPKGGEPRTEIQTEEAPAQETPKPETASPAETPAEPEPVGSGEASAAIAAMAAAETLMNEMDLEDDRPLHQRLFSTQDEPCIMPLPPENLIRDDGEAGKTEASEGSGAYDPAGSADREPGEETETEEAGKNEPDAASGTPEENTENREKGEDNA